LNSIPEVDAIVVAYNGGHGLLAAVESLLGSEDVVLNVIVVDNASTDDSIAALQGLPVNLVALKHNVGFGAGFNVGFYRSHAPWAVCVNQDTLVRPNTLRLLIETSQSDIADGVPVIAAPCITRLDGTIVETCHRLPSLWSQCKALMLGERFGTRNIVPPSAVDKGPVLCDWVSAVLILGSRETFARLKAFDETYFMYVEDIDFFFRLKQLGGRCIWQPRAVVTHSGGVDPATRGAVSGELYGLTLWNLKRYFQKRAGYAPRFQGAVILAAGCLGSALRCLMWSGRRLLGMRRQKQGDTAMQGAMACMFAGGARAAATALVTGRVPSRIVNLITDVPVTDAADGMQ